MTLILVGLLTLVGSALAATAYGVWYFRWEARNTTGMAYYGRPLAERRRLKKRIRLYSAPLRPLVRLMARVTRVRTTMPYFVFEGVSGPPRVSSPEVFARAKAYLPRPEDVFVVTQMRCGTTWMQQVVYEVVSGGRGDLSDTGHRHLYAMSPWIDGINSVSLEDAPIVGRRPSRIIKSHLPVALCPYSPEAKYIYVTRHPVSCFASIVDYNRSLLGPLAPPVDVLADWFCSDRMYWQPWPKHVSEWWQRAQSRSNVLFVRFEDMKEDLGMVVDQVARMLDCSLTASERNAVLRRCSFANMRRHEELFEMAPPTMFSVAGGRFFASGEAFRGDGIASSVRDGILMYLRQSTADSGNCVHALYPDLAGAIVR